MNPEKHKLRHTTNEELESAKDHSLQSGAKREFATPEEMIAFDRARTEVPEAVRQRVADSVRGDATQTPKPWWKRLF